MTGIATKGQVLLVSVGGASGITAFGLWAEMANAYQAFFGIIFGGCTLCIFLYATMRNQRRQDARLDEDKRHNKAMEPKDEP